MQAVRLRTEYMKNPIGIDICSPRLSWVCEGGITQKAYEISAREEKTEIWNSGKEESSRMNACFGTMLCSRQQIFWRVRLWDEENRPGGWSDEAVFEMGLLEKESFLAKWINPELETVPDKRQPASWLRKRFQAETGKKSRLYITCHGLYVAYLNGRRVGDFVLAPGTGSYDKKLAYQTYDVTDLIKSGENELLVVLGDGWYRGCTGVSGDRNLFGSDVSLFCQLETDGKAICVSDETWQASQRGPIRENDMQQGELYDARMDTVECWHGVKTENFGTSQLVCSNSVPVREWEHFSGKLITTPNGEKVIDFGQNLAGYVEFTLTAHAGEKIVLSHGEALDENGNFTNSNFQPGKRHKEGGIRQQIEYICKEGYNHYKPKFCIFGFRYARIETDNNLKDAIFTAHAVYSEMEETGEFICSNEAVNQLIHNCVWSQKSNFCDIPTDCPTRERAGWTGDAGIFVGTGLYLTDCYPVFRKWLGECRLMQKPDGRIYNIAPPNGKHSMFSEILSGSVGWGDACIIVPYTLYKRYGDSRILEDNYEMMTGWYRYLEARAKKNKLRNRWKKNPFRNYTIDTGVDYGEWCEPGVGLEGTIKHSSVDVATAYLSWSGRLLGEIAGILGKVEEARHYREVSEMAGKAFCYTATREGRIVSERQCEYVRALAFQLLDKKESQQAAHDLNELVKKNDYHLNTGFLSTPFLCKVLADYGYIDTAYRLLLQDTVPSWLYAVKKGATTIWENWDGIREDGTVHASLNHYSYGVIAGWLFQGVCGICLEDGLLTLTPKPSPLLGAARAIYQSPWGRIESGWSYGADGKVEYEFDIPANMCANVEFVDGKEITLRTGRHRL